MASKNEWNSFFLDAKIPKDVAAKYAVNFYRNRMSFEMLPDLNKVSKHLDFFDMYGTYDVKTQFSLKYILPYVKVLSECI